MRSTIGIASALLFLLAPVAAIASVVLSQDAPDIVVHLFLGAGSLAFALAAFDFGLPRWINVVGAITGIALGAIFLLQALSLMVPNDQLTNLAFTQLGQTPEGVLGLGFLVWFAGLLVYGSKGRSRYVGMVIVPVAFVLEVLALVGVKLPIPNVVVFLAPFVWLLIEGAKQRPVAAETPSPKPVLVRR